MNMLRSRLRLAASNSGPDNWDSGVGTKQEKIVIGGQHIVEMTAEKEKPLEKADATPVRRLER